MCGHAKTRQDEHNLWKIKGFHDKLLSNLLGKLNKSLLDKTALHFYSFNSFQLNFPWNKI